MGDTNNMKIHEPQLPVYLGSADRLPTDCPSCGAGLTREELPPVNEHRQFECWCDVCGHDFIVECRDNIDTTRIPF